MSLLPRIHQTTFRFTALLLVGLIVGAITLMPQRTAKADTTYVVDTVSDNGSLNACTAAANDCSLRGAIAASNSAGGTNTITFDSSVFNPDTITVASQLSINSNLTITGDGKVTLSGGGTSRILNIQSGATVTLDGLTITDGYVNGSGGAIANSGDLTISYSTVANSTATSNGAAVYNAGTLLVFASTINGNSADHGGGVFVTGTSANLVNSTFYNNSATSGGGGVYVTSAVTLTNSTLSNNNTSGNGDGIRINSGTAVINNSILANGTGSGGDCSRAGGTTVTIQYTLIEDGSCGITGGVNGNLTGDPQLLPLANNGGITKTMELQPTSPVINAASKPLAVLTPGNKLIDDQRGGFYIRDFGGLVDMGAVDYFTLNFRIDLTSDEDIRGCSFVADDCTLRGAINLANTVPGADIIVFNTGVFSPNTITLTSNLPNIATPITIDGLGASLVTVDGANAYRIFNVNSGVTAAFNALTIANGSNSAAGGGGIHSDGNVTVTDSVLTGNSTTSNGGAIYSSGTLVVNGSTVSASSATDGGGLYNDGGTMTVVNSTVTGSTAQDGGGIANSTSGGNSLTVTNSTIAGNTATNYASGVLNSGGTLNLNNTIIADNSGGITQCANNSVGITTNAQYTLIQSGLGCVNGTNTGNLSVDPLLGALTGSSGYFPLDSASPAINAGSNALAIDAGGGALTIDEAGNARIYGGTVDMGAAELAYTTFVVDTTSDANLTNCGPAPNDCSLRGAINFANAYPDTNTITFDSSVFTPDTITLTSDLPTITSDVDITGLGHNKIIVNGASSYHPFTVASGVTASITGMSLSNGFTSGSGGGITNNGVLTVADIFFSHTSATLNGGGIYNASTGTLMLSDSNFIQTSAASGGGLYSEGGTTTVDNTTFFFDTSTSDGGGIALSGSGVTLVVTGSTFTGNSTTATSGAIFITNSSTATVSGSTFSNNSSTFDGGAIHIINSGALTLSASSMSGNHTTDANSAGGAIANEGTLVVSGTTFSGNNHAFRAGGAINNLSIATVSGSTFTGNNVPNNGGSINSSGGGTLTVVNSTMTGNSALNGAGIFLGIGTVTVTNSTIASNNGDGVLNNGGTVNLYNSILADNSGSGGTDCPPSSFTTNAQNTLIKAGLDCVSNDLGGNLTGDPSLGTLMGSPAYFPLDASSIAINAGSNSLLNEATVGVDYNGDGDTSDTLTTDEAGNTRIAAGKVDMGAYEVECPASPHTVAASDVTDLVFSIKCANETATDDVINLTNSTYTLTMVDNSANGNNGLPSIVTSATAGTLTINGSGATITRDSSAPQFRLFYVNGGADLTVTDMTLSGGDVGGNSGGGIYNRGALKVISATVSGNSALTGGGIYNALTGTLTVTNSTITANSGTDGGGILNTGTATLINSTVSTNSAAVGGGIYVANPVTLYNSIIANSTGADCLRDGLASSTVTAQNSLIEDSLSCVTTNLGGNLTSDPLLAAPTGSPAYYPLNTGSIAVNAGDNALAVDAGSNPLTTDEAGNARIFGTIVDIGAYEATYSYNFVVDRTDDNDIEGCSPSPNDCSLRGAINLANATAGTQTITFDSSVFNPGTINLTSALPDITSTIVIDGLGTSLVTVDGSGISAGRIMIVSAGADLTLDNLTIANTVATVTGGVAFVNGANLTVTDSAFTGNANIDSGGVFLITGNGTANISGSTFSGNSGGTSGGAIRVSSGMLTLSDCTMTGNYTTNTDSSGGAIYVSSSATVNVANCTLDTNTSIYGGAIYSLGSLTVSGSTLSTNSTTTNGGGAIYVQDGTTTVIDSTLDGNSAPFGGGIAVVGGDLTVSGSTFSGNSANGGTSGGGGVYIQGVDSATIINSTFSGNTSASSGGGLRTLTSATTTITNSTFYGNTATSTGGGVYRGGSGILNLNNSIFAGNTKGDCNRGGGTVNVKNSLIKDGTCSITNGVDGNLTGDPDLGMFTGVYYPLNSTSFAINAGDNTLAVGADGIALTTDQPGSARIQQGIVDMGSYESSFTAPVPVIITQPQDQTIFSGQTATLTVVASGPSLSYQWYQGLSGDTSTPVGTDSDSFTTPMLTSDTSYWVQVSNLAGSADSDTATVYIPDFMVDTTSDADLETCSSAPGDCSLRGAINLANTFAGTVTITFDSSVFNPGTITLAGSSLPDVTTEIIIDGTGAANTIVQASTCNPVTLSGGCTPADYRVFHVTSAGNLTLDSLTVQYGGLTGFENGGGVYNQGMLTVTNSTITANAISRYGGGIALETGSTLAVSNSTIIGNSADYGAGIYVHRGTTATITDSTISGNIAVNNGGAIYSQDTTTLTVTNSTFSGNSAAGGNGGAILSGGTLILSDSTLATNSASAGGGIFTEGTETKTIFNSTFSGNSATTGGAIDKTGGPLTVTNSTLSGNSAVLYGGIEVYGSITLNNSIIANSTGSDCHHAGSGTINAQNSLIEDGLTCVNGTNSNNLTGDPKLAPLANNGGSTLTHALLPDSPAINAGSSALASGITTDQRGAGFPRIVGGTVDIGAYEADLGTLNVQLTLQGRTNPAPHSSYVVTVHVEIMPDGGGAAFYSQDFVSNANGVITIPNLPTGTYLFSFKGSHTLAREYTLTIVNGANSKTTDLLLEGDGDDQNAVTITDFAILAASFGKTQGMAGYDGRADFNGDTAVTILDFSLLAANFGRVGDGGVYP